MIYLAIGLGLVLTLVMLSLCCVAGQSDKNSPRDPLYERYWRAKHESENRTTR